MGEGLQRAVAAAKATRAPKEPGQQFLKHLLNYMPDDECKAEVTEVFASIMHVGETKNAVAAFMYLVREYKAEVLEAAQAKRAAEYRRRAEEEQRQREA